MNTKELREKFFQFYKGYDHKLIPSASLLPENDPTVLFTTAGMHPLVPFLLGSPHPEGKRLVNVQKCIRTQDIDDVGDAWHSTFFEMLGYWSLGDYFKKEAIERTFAFLTKQLGFDANSLAVTVFMGEGSIPSDEESYSIWKNLGFSNDQIFKLGKEENFWGPAGMTGPCGPCSETFFVTTPNCNFGRTDCSPACKCGRYVELCNNVFMQYDKKGDGSFTLLPQKNVDFGMGLLRVVSIFNHLNSIYESDVYSASMQYLKSLSNELTIEQRRIIVDHIQAAMFAIGDGIRPNNVGAGYIVRRLLRRAFRLANQAKLQKEYIEKLVKSYGHVYEVQYPEIIAKQSEILQAIYEEEDKFVLALGQGLKYFEKELERLQARSKADNQTVISGQTAFYMFETFGFPLEVTQEIAKERGFSVDVAGFTLSFQEHQEKSRMAGDKLFKGGLADNSETVTKLHTATHLLHEALRKVLGPHVEQKGSNITAERLRFDFSHPNKLTDEELKKVETLVNEQIQKQLSISVNDMSIDDAQVSGAIGLFESKYGARVSVYSIGNFSKEICGGPHVKNTSELGRFSIKKEEASSRGVRRIKAVLD